ncbi:MAG TPA: ribonuclease E inhibitor RraB [Polyangiaceae bacterium]|jgi:hypothetical protein|nr:ribonuclease E inhibitor RraB [Polyangiaceae bacterium]
MKVSLGQSYFKPGAKFPFSHRMQVWMSEELSSLAKHFTEFERKYGAGYELMIQLSADRQISDNEIRGPAVYKKDKDVEYTLFLPYDVIIETKAGCRGALEYLLNGIFRIFELTGIDSGMLDERRDSIITHICSDPTMLDEPWPTRSGVKPPRTAVTTEKDADEAVLRRAAEEWDISEPMNVEFAIDTPNEAAAEELARLAVQRGYTTSVYVDEVEEDSTCYCTKRMVPTQDAIARAQRELEELSAPFGGRADEWSLSRP